MSIVRNAAIGITTPDLAKRRRGRIALKMGDLWGDHSGNPTVDTRHGCLIMMAAINLASFSGIVRTRETLFVSNHLEISEVGDVTVVRFADGKILDASNIEELGAQLFHLVEVDKRLKLLLNFQSVEFLSSAALNKLIILDKKMKGISGKLKLCCLKPEILEVFVITRLNQLFEIADDEEAAVALF